MSEEALVAIEVGTGCSKDASGIEAGRSAAREAASAIHRHAICVTLVYASVAHDLVSVLQGVQEVVGETPVLGATTAGELIGGFCHQSVVVVVLASPHLRVAAAVGRDVSKNWQAAFDEAFSSSGLRSMVDESPEHTQERTRRGSRRFAMLIAPGNTRQTASFAFEAMETFKTRTLGRIPIFAGASADDWRMESNAVLFGRQVVADGLLLAVFETELSFGIALGHGFHAAAETLKVTAVEGREVLALDGHPAAERLAQRLGANFDELAAVHLTLTTGKTLGTSDSMGQYSVNVATYFTPRGGVRLTQPVAVGAELAVMKPVAGSMLAAGGEALRKAMLRAGTNRPAAVLCHYCALRPRIMGAKGAQREIAEMVHLAGGAPLVGFCSFGEGGLSDDGVSRPNNGAIAVLVIGNDLSEPARVARDIERLQVQSASQEELRLWGMALKQTEEAFVVGDNQYRVTYVNPAFSRLFGYSPEEIIGKPIHILTPEDETALGAAELSRRILAERSFHGEVRRRTKDGRVIPCLLNVALLVDEANKGYGWVGAFTDITARKAAETRLRESEARFRETFDNAPIGMVIAPVDSRCVLAANRTFCEFLGYSIEELRTLSLQDLSHPEDLQLSLDGLRDLAQGESGSYVVEKRYRRKDGRYVWGQATATVVHGDDAAPRYLIVQIEDIEKRKAADEALREAKERLAMALEASELSIWDYNIATGTVALDEHWATMMGLAPGGTITTAAELTRITHPDDVDRAMRAAVAAFKGTASAYVQESRLRSAAGSWKWIRCSGKVVQRDASGRAIRAIGTNLDITARKAAEERIREMAFIDLLTGLPNRALFLDRLQQAISAAQRESRTVAVMYVDLDRFKEINDTQGHDVGDRVLREVAKRFSSVMRASDTLARLGGDEFGIVASNVDHVEASLIAKRVGACLDQKITVDLESFAVGVSVGIAFYPEDGATPDLLLRNADIAMYRAKISRQGLAVYNDAMSAGLAERLALARDLQEALAGPQGQLSLHYQPQVELRSGALTGAEALLRWRHPQLGPVATDVFLSLAEERGLMTEIGKWVLAQACHQMAEWRDAGLVFPGRLAINISAQELEDGEFFGRLLEHVHRFGLPPEQLEFELTESGVMRNVDRAVELLGQLNRIGFSLAVDDFGTGYSSLAYLKRLPVGKLKIDRTFVRDMAEDTNDHAIAATIVAMGRTLGLLTVAEGVETRTQADALLALGCDQAQGYLFGRPEPPDVFAAAWLGPNPQNVTASYNESSAPVKS